MLGTRCSTATSMSICSAAVAVLQHQGEVGVCANRFSSGSLRAKPLVLSLVGDVLLVGIDGNEPCGYASINEFIHTLVHFTKFIRYC
jgi:hypothetical protein